MLKFCNFIIRYAFYALFLLVPLVFTSDTSELFEFNKMWLTFGLTTIIVAAWITKMIAARRIIFQRTILDIPILLFLVSQTISTIFSLDQHVSLWGYYSRWNGGLFSIASYILLYYAFASNIFASGNFAITPEPKKFVFNILKISLASGLVVSLWGLPAHFGYDPTCLVFRGSFDVSCWTDAFQPKVRIFSTMGQPDWLAAYLSVLIPIAIAFGLEKLKQKKYLLATAYSVLTVLFYLDFIYTKAKGSFIALAISIAFFLFFLTLNKLKQKENQDFPKKFALPLIIAVIFLVITFFAGQPFAQLDKFTFGGIISKLSQPTFSPSSQISEEQANAPKANPITGEFGGTDSGKIRLFVWEGAIQAWLHNPIFGTGVETFAFAYYQYRPAGHNLTSEWDYLYNKAHNEYLNYLATTGAFGLLSYLFIIILFLFIALKTLWKSKLTIQNQYFLPAILAAFFTILISNFFGFSVVIINIFFFFLPLFFLVLSDKIKVRQIDTEAATSTGLVKKIGIGTVWVVAVYLNLVLTNYWFADKAYGLGANYDKVGQYQTAHSLLMEALNSRPYEPVFQDEMSVNDAALAANYFEQKDATNAAALIQESIALSDNVVANHPNNVTYWKSRVKILYTLSQADGQYIQPALEAIQKAHQLAPTDAKISYNLGLLYSQTGQQDKAIQTLQQTVKLKPDYRDAYYALGLILHQAAIDKNNQVVDQQKEQQAVAAIHFILDKISPTDQAAKDALSSWGEK